MKKITMSAIVEDGTEEEICQGVRKLVGEKNGTVEDLQVKDAPGQDANTGHIPPEAPPPKGVGATLRSVA